LEGPEVRVVSEEMRHRLRVAEVVQGDDVDVRTESDLGAEEVAADPPEPVDANADRHAGESIGGFPRRAAVRASARGELLEAMKPPVHRRLAGWGARPYPELAKRVRRIAKAKLGGLAERVWKSFEPPSARNLRAASSCSRAARLVRTRLA